MSGTTSPLSHRVTGIVRGCTRDDRVVTVGPVVVFIILILVVVVVVVAFFVVVPRRRKSESVRDGDVVDAERDARTRARAGTTRGIADIDRGGRVGVFRRVTRDE